MSSFRRESPDNLSTEGDSDDNFNHDKDCEADNLNETDRKDNFDHNNANLIDNIGTSAAASGPSSTASDINLVHNEDECSGTSNQSDNIRSELRNRLTQACGALRLRLPLNSSGCDNDNELKDKTKTRKMVVKSQEGKRSHDDNNDNVSSGSSSQRSDESGSTIKAPRGQLFYTDSSKGSSARHQKDDSDLEATLKLAKSLGRYNLRSSKKDKNSIELQSNLPEWQSIDGDHQSTMSGCYGSYTRFPSISFDKSVAQASNSRKSSITPKLKRESHRPSRSDGYSRLGYPSKTKISKSSAFLQKYASSILLDLSRFSPPDSL